MMRRFYDLGNGTGIISTTDFFMPIVDSPFDFGRIAAAKRHQRYFGSRRQAIMASRSLAGRLTPAMLDIAREVTEGRFACRQAGITLAGRTSTPRSRLWSRGHRRSADRTR